jgi:glycosyltransferase involved in cell wall biosynthesis
VASDEEAKRVSMHETRRETTISVAMATYNGARFIGEQLDSLARQTRPPMELVITDDCSTDATGEIVAAFARTAPFPVHFHRNPKNLGYKANFLHATTLCRGEVIAFCDQDDVWLPHKLERCAEPFARPATSLVIHRYALVDRDLKPTGSYEPDIQHDRVLSPFAGWMWHLYRGFSLLIRSELLDLLRVEPWPATFSLPEPPEQAGPMGHDEWAWFLGGVFGERHIIAESLVLYRQHGGNLFGASPEDNLHNQLRGMRRRDAGYYGHLARIAGDLEQALRRIRPDAPAVRLAQAEAGAARCARIAAHLTRRVALHGQTRTGARLGALIGLLLAGGYRSPDQGGHGMRGLGKDALISVAGLLPRRA